MDKAFLLFIVGSFFIITGLVVLICYVSSPERLVFACSSILVYMLPFFLLIIGGVFLAFSCLMGDSR